MNEISEPGSWVPTGTPYAVDVGLAEGAGVAISDEGVDDVPIYYLVSVAMNNGDVGGLMFDAPTMHKLYGGLHAMFSEETQ